MTKLDARVGHPVERVDRDWGLLLQGSDWLLRVIGPFRPSETEAMIDPELLDLAEPIVESRVGRTITKVDVTDKNVLIVSFDDGVEWVVPPSLNFEPWEYVSPAGRTVSAIGGTPVTWPEP